MSYEIITDSSSNLPVKLIKEKSIPVVPFRYEMDGKEFCVDPVSDDRERMGYFRAMRNKSKVKTSLINFAAYAEEFEKALAAGKDVLYIGMSHGISGSFANATIAAEELREKYPDRRIELVDTLNASLGEGLPVLMAYDMRDAGDDLDTAVTKLRDIVPHMRGCFMVDDLMFLHSTGRVSGVVAVAGKALGIRPLLKGDDSGHIVVTGKVRGKKAALDALFADFDAHVLPDLNQTVAVAHCDALEDALYIAKKIRAHPAVGNVIFEWYENVTGAHLGPGAVAIFYMADHR